MGKVYKTYKLKVRDEKNNLYKSTVKLPENIEFLSVTGDINHYFHPSFLISALEDSSHSSNLKEYEFLVIDSSIKRKVNISVDGYRYVGSADLPLKYNYVIEDLYHFDIFVSES